MLLRMNGRFAPKAALRRLEIQLPLKRRKRTHLGNRGMSEKCHKQTHAVQQYALLFDHLVGVGRLVIVDCQVERHRSLMIEMSEYLVGNSTGKSEGFVPPTILSTYFVECLKSLSRSGP
jgi:hypothetical protein